VDGTKQLVAGLFGRVAASYDQAGFLHQIARRLVTHAGVRPGERVLDVACGTGAALLEAARRVGPDGVAVGIDLAEPMAAEAARRLRAVRHGRGPAAVAVMDAEQPGLRAASFDVVCLASAVYLLGEQAGTLRGLQELLRPGGRLAVSDFGDLDARWAWKDELLGRLAPPLEQLGGGCRGPAALEAALRWAGAREVRVEVERLDVVYADAAAWWAEQWTHGERRPLERMDDQALAAYQTAAFVAIEAGREADGALHWRPEVSYAIAWI
jgi:cyclopropane fatty-acyl-phospholipid synthase-like methyltransferase